VIPLVVGLLAGCSTIALVAALGVRIEPTVVSMLRFEGTPRAPVIGALGDRLLSARLLHRLARAERLADTIAATGRRVSLVHVMATKCLGAIGVMAAVMLLLGPGAAPIAFVCGGGAFLVPDVALARDARRRRRGADLEVTQFLDLLAAASSAGLSAPAAIRRASSGIRGPLGDDLESAAASVEVGGRWREELLRIADRMQLPDLRAAVVVIARTETLGSSLAESLQGLAADVRGSRRARAAERARTAPVKMLFPLVFMVLPAFLLLTVVPVLIATVRSLS